MDRSTLVSTRIVSVLTLVLALVAMVLGVVGFDGYVRGHEDFASSDLADLAYYSLQLFVLGPSAIVGGAVNLPLQIARFLAPLATLLAVVQTLALLFGDWATALVVRWQRDHAIVVGDGPAAALLAGRLAGAGTAVAVLGGAVGSQDVQGRRIAVLPGDPLSTRTLQAAGLGRSSAVYALSSSWVTNAAVALAVSKSGGPGTRIYAHMPDDDVVVAALRTLPDAGSNSALPDLVSLDGIAARTLLIEQRPGFRDHHPQPVVVMGTGSFACAVLRELAHSQRSHRERRRVLLVTDRPQAVDGASVAGLDIETIAPDLLAHRMAQFADATVYVCWADIDRVLRDGLAHRPSGSGRVVLCLRRLAGLGEALNGQRVFDAEQLAVFGVLDSACDPDRISGDTLDQYARGVHAVYVRRALDEGAAYGSQVVPWEELEPRFRADNLDSARRLEQYVEALQADIMRRSRGTSGFAFRSGEVETLARREHERWMAAKEAYYVGLGPARPSTDHPDMRPWDELDPDTQAKDLAVIAAIPDILATCGMQIVRRGDNTGTP